MVLLFYTTYISVDLAHHEIFRSKVGKGVINLLITFFCFCVRHCLSMSWCLFLLVPCIGMWLAF